MRPKVYIGKLLPEKKSYLPLLYPNLGRQYKPDRLFLDKAYDVLKTPVVDIVERPEDCDFFILPYDFFNVEELTRYLNGFVTLAKTHAKRIVIFDFSDFDKAINIPNSFVFRVSIYKSRKKVNEVVVPPFIEDLGESYGVEWRTKGPEPTVGFIGYAAVPGYRWFKYLGKVLFSLPPRRPGIYWRRKAIKVLSGKSGLATNFIVRKSYAGHKDTIAMDPVAARSQFVENVKKADYILAPKGDGNYSLRFYETLSLARVPILIDTDMVLPLEDEIDYEKFVLRINYRDVNALGEILKGNYSRLTPDNFRGQQEQARAAFVDHLRMDKFLPRAFERFLRP